MLLPRAGRRTADAGHGVTDDSTTRHDPQLRSWVDSANDPATDFPIQNLPFGVFARRDAGERARVGVAIGDSGRRSRGVRASGSVRCGDVEPIAARASRGPLNELMALGRERVARCASALSRLLRGGFAGVASVHAGRVARFSCRCATASCSCRRRSATTPTSTRRSITRRTSAACFGRTIRCCRTTSGCRSAITVARRRSCRAERRCGGRGARRATEPTGAPTFGPTRRLDYELEVGAFIGAGQRARRADSDRRRRAARVRPVSRERLVGARHPGVGVPAARSVSREEFRDDGLAVGRHAGRARAVSRSGVRRGRPAIRRRCRISLRRRTRRAGASRSRSRCCSRPRRCATAGVAPFRVSAGTFTDMYWTVAQLVTHHASNGCNLRPGDLLGERNRVGTDEGIARVPARAHVARHRAAAAADRRDARLSRGRRRGDVARLLRTAGVSSHRVRRMCRPRAAARCAAQSR